MLRKKIKVKNKAKMKEINHAANMWNKTKLEYWKKTWYELIRKFYNEKRLSQN